MTTRIEPPDPVIARDVPYHRAPEGLRENVRLALAAEAGDEGRAPRWGGFALAASFLLVAVLSWNAALWHERTTSPVGLDEAIDAHVRSLATPGRLTDVTSTDRHTVKPWFIGKLDLAPPVDDFATAGFPLAGGRLDYLDGRPAAALVYRRNAHVVNVFVSSAKNTADQPLANTTRRGYAVARWTQGGLAFTAVGDVSPADMQALVALIARG